MCIQFDKKFNILIISICIAFCGSLSGCRISLQGKKISKILSSDYCAQDYEDGPPASYTNPDSIVVVSKMLSNKMSIEEIQLANAIGILRQVKTRSELSKGKADNDLNTVRDLDFDIENRITFASNIVNSIAAETHCESERTGRIADYLDELGKKRVNKFTIGAVLAGAVTGIAPLIIKQQRPQNAVVIAGSAISAGFGIAALTNNRKKVQFSYPRNLLADIWYIPDSSNVYPKFVWLMLNEPKAGSNDKKTSVVGGLKKRWLSLEFDQNLDDHLRKLLFDYGGVFKEDELNTRQVLLNQLGTEIQLLNVKLLALARKLKTY